MARIRASRLAAVTIVLAMPLVLVNCGHIVFAAINAPAYIGFYQRHAKLRYAPAGGDAADQRHTLDVYVPRGSQAHRPVVVFWYGGMWTKGSKEQYRFVGAALANSGYVAVLPDYRLYPQVRFPQPVEDGALAVKWVHEHAAEFGGDPDALFLMGHSAGAHIAGSLALDARYLQKVGGSRAWVKGWIGLSGPYQLEPVIPILAAMFHSPYSSTDWQLLALANTHSPPALLLHGAQDYLVRATEAAELDRRLRSAGSRVTCHIYPRASHTDTVAAFSLPLRAEARSLADVQDFIDRTLRAATVGTEPDNQPCPPLLTRGRSDFLAAAAETRPVGPVEPRRTPQ